MTLRFVAFGGIRECHEQQTGPTVRCRLTIGSMNVYQARSPDLSMTMTGGGLSSDCDLIT